MIPPETIKKHRRDLLRSLGTPPGERYLEFLEKRFETHLPAFQGNKGQYDPLDAMRRDSYREILLYIRHQLELAKKESPLFSEDSDDEGSSSSGYSP